MLVEHKAGARKHPRVLALRKKWGDKGYAWLWIVREILAVQKPMPMVRVTDAQALMLGTDATEEEFNEFMKDCIKDFKLLQSDGDFIWDRSILDKYKKKRRAYGKALANRAWKNNQVKDAMRLEEYYGVRRKYSKYATPHQIENNRILRDMLNPTRGEYAEED